MTLIPGSSSSSVGGSASGGSQTWCAAGPKPVSRSTITSSTVVDGFWSSAVVAVAAATADAVAAGVGSSSGGSVIPARSATTGAWCSAVNQTGRRWSALRAAGTTSALAFA